MIRTIPPESEAPETPVPETPVPETPVPETPVPETPVPQSNTPQPGRPRLQTSISSVGDKAQPLHPFLPVAEDLEWLRDEWLNVSHPPSNAALRRGSSALRLLLVDGLVHEVWRYCGLSGGPTLVGPDLEALAVYHGHALRHAASAVAGGGIVNDVRYAMMGAWRVDHPTTGILADADEGFAVATTVVARQMAGEPVPNALDPLVNREWKLNAYLAAPGAIRRGEPITRGEIIQFFANYAGGVHLDRVAKGGKKRVLYEFITEMESKVNVDRTDGLYFELLSIGQAVGASPAMQRLAAAIREAALRSV